MESPQHAMASAIERGLVMYGPTRGTRGTPKKKGSRVNQKQLPVMDTRYATFAEFKSSLFHTSVHFYSC
jgi:hypothetical protein